MKFVGWFCKVALMVMLVSSLTVATTGWVVNAYLKSILASYNVQLPGEPLTFGSMLQGMMGLGAKDTKDADIPLVKDEVPVETKSNPTSTVEEEEPVEDALPVMGGDYKEDAAGVGQQEQLQIEQDQQVVISPDELVQKKDEMIDSDKEEIFNILMTKLPQERVQEITVAMENGLTEQELVQVESILSEYLNDEEYDKLLTLLRP
ncbi:hypothetical protein [Paenibacillus crassostreae]|uniref:Magnesium transporter MgtE intracellular domain-containing protein n=1 Tax=Paenibacillus crassostreae TaxID=1763538 RepID=A0A162KQ10_9BACL|nr:hypothetical protein [Paenibacillus crassostreae]AOZ92887.1 hypothetical protein LPB68_12130 [Paenibacillus crassostreae]OAB72023.1 hypothetical protein PNBC_18760 [Paenibacillus crassostreae]